MPNRPWFMLTIALCGIAGTLLVVESNPAPEALDPDRRAGGVAAASASESDKAEFAGYASDIPTLDVPVAGFQWTQQAVPWERLQGSRSGRSFANYAQRGMPQGGSVDASTAATESLASAVNPADDLDVTRKVRLALSDDVALARREIAVSTHDGEVRLRGVLGSQAEIEHAIDVARGVEGVYAIDDELAAKR